MTVNQYLPTVVLRHRKENLKKCSLRGLESREDFRFLTYPLPPPPHFISLSEFSGYILLAIDAPPLSVADAECGLFVVDATWRYAAKMVPYVESQGEFIRRSIPDHYRTAYPRQQTDCADPERGLASLEAIFIAYHLLGRDVSGLLDGYHWKELFLQKNKKD